MSIRVDIDRLVLHDIALAHADRRRLLAAVEHAIADRLATAAPHADATDSSVPVIHARPIALPGQGAGHAALDSLAAGIATATTGAVAQLRGGTP